MRTNPSCVLSKMGKLTRKPRIILLYQYLIHGIVIMFSLLSSQKLQAQCSTGNTPFSANCNGCPTSVSYTLGPSTTGFMLDVLTLDNSFNISVNGTKINARELEFEYYTSQGTTVTLPEFVSDGAIYNSAGTVSPKETANAIWQMNGTANNPLIRIIIDGNGNTSLFGSRVSGGPLFPMRIRSGYQAFNAVSWNLSSNNTVSITQAGRGPTNMTGLFIPIEINRPLLSTNNINNACNANTTSLSLSGLVSNSCTPGSVLQWHTVSTNFSNSTLVQNATAVGNGTYFPVCFSSGSNCYGLAANPGVTATIILPPVSSNYIYCQGETASQLTATATSGSALRWYTQATGGAFSTTAPTPSTATVGTFTYYVSQRWGTACETIRTPITVTVNAKPSAPVAPSVTYCQRATATPLLASGINLLWYTSAIGGTGSTTAPTPSTLTAGTTNYYVSQTVNGCESNRTTIAVLVKPTPDAPVANSVAYCQGATSSPLLANVTSGATLQWYTVAINGTASASAPTPSSTSVGSTTYYVSQLLNACESIRTAVGVLINPNPSLSLGTNTNICPGSKTAITAITAGGTPSYTYAINNGAFQSGNVFSGIGQGTYAITVKDNKGCTNSQSITITEKNSLSLVTEVSYTCTPFNSGVITANGASTQGGGAVSYNINGGTFASNNIFSSLSPGTYSVSVKDNNCTITNTVNVNTVTDLGLSLSSQNNCIIGSTGTITVTASGGVSPYSYNIDGGAFGGSAIFNGLAAGPHTINVKDARECLQSLSVTIVEKPSAPIVTSPTICLGSSTVLSATCVSGSPKWYSNSSLTIALPSTTVSPFTTTSYFATCEIITLNCKSTSTSSLVSVNPVPSVNAISNQFLCKGSNTSSVTFTGAIAGTVYNWTNSNAEIGLASSGSGDIPSFSAENDGNSPIVGTITVTPSFTLNGIVCNGVPISFTITVNPTPIIDNIANQIVCNGQNTTITISGASTSYNWSYNSTNIGLAATGTLASSGSNSSVSTSFNAINNSNDPITATLMVTPNFFSGGLTCIGTPKIFTIIVNHNPIVDNISSQVKCNNTSNDAINFTGNNASNKYDWVHTNTTIGLPESGTGNIPFFSATNTGSSPNLSIFTVTPKYVNGGSTCIGTEKNFNFTVNHTPTVDFVGDQLKCNNTFTDAISFSGNNPSNIFNWSHSNANIGLTSFGLGNIAAFTATNLGSNPINSTFTVTPSYSNGGLTCYGTNKSFRITVTQTPSINAIIDQAKCNANSINAINFSGNNSSNEYSWSQTNTSIGLDGSTGSGNISSFAATNTGATPIVSTFTVTPSFTNAGLTCFGSAKNFAITVHPTPQATITPSSLNICSGDNISMLISDAKSVPGTTIFAWNRNNTSNITGLMSGTNNTINGVLNNITTSTQTSIFNGILTSQFGCINSTTASVKVTPPLSVTISGNEYFCGTGGLNNTTLLTAVPLGGTGIYSYQWNLNGLPINGATNSTYPAGVVGNYSVTVTSEFCAKTSSIKTVQSYNLGAAPSIMPNTATLCGSGTVTFTAISTSTLGTINWYADASTTTNLASGTTFNTPTISISTTYFAARSYIIVGSSPLVTCETSRTPAEVFIYPSTSIPIISANLNTICSGSSTTLANSTSCTGKVTWSDGSNTSLGTGNSITVSPMATTTYRATCTEGSCSSISTALQVTVNSIAAGTIQMGLTNPTGCSPLDPNITGVTVAAVGAGALSYTWQQSTNGGSTWTPAIGQLNPDGSQINPEPLPITTRLRRIATSTLNGLTCSAISNEIEYIVNPLPVLSIIATNPSATVCVGSSITLSATASGGTPTYTFQWEKGSTAVAGNGNSYTISSTTLTDAGTYKLTVTDSKGCKDIAQRTTNIISSIGGVVSSNTSVNCNGSNNGFLTLSGHIGNVVNWQYSTNGGTSWTDIANTSTSQSYNNLSSTTQFRAVVKNGSCNSTNSTVATITVPPSLNIIATPTSLSCNNNASGSVSLTATGGIPVYQYALNEGALQTTNTFSGLSAGTYSVTVTDAKGCTKTVDNIVVGQPKDVLATFSSIKPICPGGKDGSISLETLTGGTSPYQFKINGGANSTINSTPGVLSNSLFSGTYTIEIIDSKSCSKPYLVIIPIGTDIIPPTIICPADLSVSCEAVPNAPTLTAKDNCDTNPTVTFSETKEAGSCTNVYKLKRTWTAKDASGNVSSCSQVITVEDKTAPIITGTPAALTVSCLAEVPIANINAVSTSDNCGTVNTIVEDNFIQNFDIAGCNRAILQADCWTINSASLSGAAGIPISGTCSIYSSQLSNPAVNEYRVWTPALFITAPSVITFAHRVTNLTSSPNLTVTALNISTNVETTLFGPFSYVNTNVITQTINFALPTGSYQIRIKPSGSGGTSRYIMDNLKVTNAVQIIQANGSCTTTLPLVCQNKYKLTRTWTATDVCGNSSTSSQVITVGDQTAPTITGTPTPVTVSCAADVPAASISSVSATDNCAGIVTVTVADVTTHGACSNKFTVTRTWTATDECGNTSSTSQVITVEDKTAPILSDAPANITVSCEAVPIAANLTATDNCDTAPVVSYAEVRTNGTCANNYTLTRTWTATDVCGNTSSRNQVITVEDKTAPILSDAPANITVSCEAVPTAAVLTATDNCDTAPVVTYAEVRTNGACSNSYILSRTWTATDVCGNTSSKNQVITVEDKTAPILSAAPADETVSCEAVPTAANLTATDNCDTAPVVTYAEVRTDGTCANSYILTRTWTATDVCGNTSSKNQVITVEDKTAPILSDVPANITVSCEAVPTAAVLTATDNCDTVTVVSYEEVRTNGTCANSYILTRTWTATDVCGNTSSRNQVITVEDKTAPILSDAPANITVSCEAVPTAAVLTATDNCDTAPVVSYAEVRTNGTCANSYILTRTWTATDECGNTSSTSQVITVEDKTAPILSDVPENITVSCEAVPTAAVLTATDNCDTVTVVSYEEVRTNGTCANSYILTRTWTATDVCGNTSSRNQVITVEDKTAPILSDAPANITVSCEAVPTAAILTSTDNCDSAPLVSYAEVRTNGTCANSYTLTRTWTATDVCGNTSSRNQVITVEDKTAPILSDAPANITVSCEAVPQMESLSAVDNCWTAINVASSEVRNEESCGNYTLVRNWTATDVCGNSSSRTQNIKVHQKVISVETDVSNVSCSCDLGSTATVSLGILNGCSGNTYQYSSNGSDYQDSPIFNNVKTGSSTFYVRNSFGCVSGIKTIAINSPSITTLPLPRDTTICLGNKFLLPVNTNIKNKYIWHRTANGNEFINKPNTDSVGVSTYYVSQTPDSSDCESLRVPITIRVIDSTLTIIEQPIKQTICKNTFATFGVVTSGFVKSYQWQKNGINIIGANAQNYNIPVASESAIGQYSCVITGNCRSIVSKPAFLEFSTCQTTNDFDLALRTTVIDTNKVFYANTLVEYKITVYNQGKEKAYNISVINYIPKGMSFEGSKNWTWKDNQLTTQIDSLSTGDSISIELALRINADQISGKMINIAEIFGADKDKLGKIHLLADNDSRFDRNSSNDIGGKEGSVTDNAIFGNGDGENDIVGGINPEYDEDDADPTIINIQSIKKQCSDLALRKRFVQNDSEMYLPNESARFKITVYNQCPNASSYNIDIIDYIPKGLDFDIKDSTNQYWQINNDNEVVTRIDSLLGGDSISIEIVLKVNYRTKPGLYITKAEIFGADLDKLGTNHLESDVDSHFDKNDLNDIGGRENSPTDDMILGDGDATLDRVRGINLNHDEDDEDPAAIVVIPFVSHCNDLAIRNQPEYRLVKPMYLANDTVKFEITVYNQCENCKIYNVNVVNYIPKGMELDATNPINKRWSINIDTIRTSNGTIRMDTNAVTLVDSLMGTEGKTIEIVLKIKAGAKAGEYINKAEIYGASNDFAGTIPIYYDRDGTFDSDQSNDIGGKENSPTDDNILGDGNEYYDVVDGILRKHDEDDEDPALIVVGDINCLALSKDSINGTKWYDFFDKNGRLFASINPNGQNLGKVSLSIRHYGNLLANIPATNNGTKFMSRYFDFVSSLKNSYENPVSIKLYFTDEEFATYKKAVNLSAFTPKDFNIVRYVGPNQNCRLEDNDNFIEGYSDVIYKDITNDTLFKAIVVQFNTQSLAEFGATANIFNLIKGFIPTRQENVVSLKWESTLEVNGAYYLIDRSIDCKQFVALEKVSTKAVGFYNYSDNSASAVTNCYRISFVDSDGTRKILDTSSIQKAVPNGKVLEKSNIIVYRNEDLSPKCSIYPNPISDLDNINLELENLIPKKVSLSNVTGTQLEVIMKPINEKRYQLQLGSKIESSNFYYLVLCDQFGRSCSLRFAIKQN